MENVHVQRIVELRHRALVAINEFPSAVPGPTNRRAALAIGTRICIRRMFSFIIEYITARLSLSREYVCNSKISLASAEARAGHKSVSDYFSRLKEGMIGGASLIRWYPEADYRARHRCARHCALLDKSR
jgi:hypothetical protein